MAYNVCGNDAPRLRTTNKPIHRKADVVSEALISLVFSFPAWLFVVLGAVGLCKTGGSASFALLPTEHVSFKGRLQDLRPIPDKLSRNLINHLFCAVESVVGPTSCLFPIALGNE